MKLKKSNGKSSITKIPLITSLSDGEPMVYPLDYIGFGSRSRKDVIAKSLKCYVVWKKSFFNYIDGKITVLVTKN